MLHDFVICEYIFSAGRKYFICPMMNQVAVVCLCCANTSRCKGTDYGTDTVLGSEMVGLCVHRIVSQTDL